MLTLLELKNPALFAMKIQSKLHVIKTYSNHIASYWVSISERSQQKSPSEGIKLPFEMSEHSFFWRVSYQINKLNILRIFRPRKFYTWSDHDTIYL